MSILPKMSSFLDEHYECIMFATQGSQKKKTSKEQWHFQCNSKLCVFFLLQYLRGSAAFFFFLVDMNEI